MFECEIKDDGGDEDNPFDGGEDESGVLNRFEAEEGDGAENDDGGVDDDGDEEDGWCGVWLEVREEEDEGECELEAAVDDEVFGLAVAGGEGEADGLGGFAREGDAPDGEDEVEEGEDGEVDFGIKHDGV